MINTLKAYIPIYNWILYAMLENHLFLDFLKNWWENNITMLPICSAVKGLRKNPVDCTIAYFQKDSKSSEP